MPSGRPGETMRVEKVVVAGAVRGACAVGASGESPGRDSTLSAILFVRGSQCTTFGRADPSLGIARPKQDTSGPALGIEGPKHDAFETYARYRGTEPREAR